MTTRESVIKAVAVLSVAFNRANSPALTEAFQIALSDLTSDEVAGGLEAALKGSKFMPTPSELRAFARPPRDIALETARAWEAVRAAIDAHDYTTSVDFGPLVNAVVRNLGGWQALCAAPVKDLEVWRRKEFERVYALLASSDPLTLHGAPLRGAVPGPIVAVAIEGQPSPARALPAADNDSRAAARALIADLASGKTLEQTAAPDLRIPPRPSFKPKPAPMTPADVEARKAEIRAQMAARGVVLPEATAMAAEGSAP